MSHAPEDCVLKVRRSIHVKAPPDAVWRHFASFDRLEDWWGHRAGAPEAGTSKGQWLEKFEPRRGGRIEMSVDWGGERVGFGGEIEVFAPGRELTFANDWIPNRGWAAPTHVTLRLTPALDGTLVELFHHGFEHTGGDIAAEHAGYEAGWGMTQLLALKRVCEAHM